MARVVTIGVYEFDLASFLDALLAELPADAATAPLCVEADPAACHRSLLAERYGLEVRDVRP